jgi:predicted metal-dependent phosphoesterase TrpH
MFLADFHMHSNFSDGKLSIPELVDLYGKRGFGAIAITDHLCEEESVIGRAAKVLGNTLTRASFPHYMEILKSEGKRAMERYGMVVIPGFELTKNTVINDRSAHILGLGVTEFLSADADVYDLALKLRSQGALTIAAHPVPTRKFEKQTYQLWNRRRELSQVFDAWEVASGPYLFHEVLRSGLPLIANSDLHVKKQMTSWKTLLQCERHPEAILEAIRKQELQFLFYDAKSHESLGVLEPLDLLALDGSTIPTPLRNLACA